MYATYCWISSNRSTTTTTTTTTTTVIIIKFIHIKMNYCIWHEPLKNLTTSGSSDENNDARRKQQQQQILKYELFLTDVFKTFVRSLSRYSYTPHRTHEENPHSLMIYSIHPIHTHTHTCS